MSEIILTQGQVAIVDPEDYALASQYRWCAVNTRSGFYAARAVNRKLLYLHRFIMDAQPGDEIDHHDGNGLNCQRLNLRKATRSENNCNRRKWSKRSQYKGVRPTATGKWNAYVLLNNKRHFLGLFDTELDAARAYDVAAKGLHGEFCRLNFPEVA